MKNKVSLALTVLVVCSIATPVWAQKPIQLISAAKNVEKSLIRSMQSGDVAKELSIVGPQIVYSKGLQESLSERMKLVNTTALLPATTPLTKFRDPAFLPLQQTYVAPVVYRQEAVTKQLLLNDILQFISNNAPNAGMLEVGHQYFRLPSPAAFPTVFNRFATAVTNQHLGMKQLSIIRKGILLGEPLQEIEKTLQELQNVTQANPIQHPEVQEDRLFIFRDQVLNQRSLFGAPVHTSTEGEAKQAILDEVSRKCRHWEAQINTYYKQIQALPKGAPEFVQSMHTLTQLFAKYERAIASWTFVREGIMNNIPASKLKADLFAFQRKMFEDTNRHPFLIQ